MRILLCVIALELLVSCGKNDTPTASSEPSADTKVAEVNSIEPPPVDSIPADGVSAAASVDTLADNSYVCRPAGISPFPAVLYNHGGLAMVVGGNLLETCTALASAGYLARSEQRPLSDSPSIVGHLDEVINALTELRSHPDADTSRIGIMGYSRGGLLALHTALQRPADLHAIILMAPAPGGGPTTMDNALEDVSPIAAPVRLLVSENDGPPAQKADHVDICQQIKTKLQDAQKEVELTIYPPFRDDGHELFFEVESIYWPDVLSFFSQHLKM